MSFEEYMQMRNALKAEGKELAKAGKIVEAEAKAAEIDKLDAEFQTMKENKAEEHALEEHAEVATGLLQDNQTLNKEVNEMPVYDASSKEYRNAFLKMISGREDQLTKMENAAFVHTTSNTSNVLPTTMLNQIWDLVSQQHVIWGDITKYRTGTILELAKHTEIAQGKAKSVAENAANDDEKNTFVKVTLSGKDFSKSLEISYAEAEMSIDALENYLVTEIATNMGEALADDVVATLKGTTNGIAAANQIKTSAAGKLTFADVANTFAVLKRANAPAVYCTRKTLYTRLAQLEDTAGHLIYQPSATVGVPGTLLGAPVKIEDSVDDDELLIGDPKKIVSNVISDIIVETDKDIKLHKYIYSGYARQESALIDPEAFASLTVKTA